MDFADNCRFFVSPGISKGFGMEFGGRTPPSGCFCNAPDLMECKYLCMQMVKNVVQPSEL